MGSLNNPYTHLVKESELGAVLYFDGDCAFCTKSARVGQRLRLKCSFTPLQSVDAESLGIDKVRAQYEVPLSDGHGNVLYGHESIAAALRTGSIFWRTLGYVITLGPVSHLSARIYRVVARHRHDLPGGTTRSAINT